MKKILISFILLLMFSASAYAADGGVVDLTEFAAGDSSTHSHVWLDKYDADNHWQECQLCAAKQNVTVHSLSTRWTVAEGSCDPHNNKQTECSECSYSVSVPDRGNHTLLQYGLYNEKIDGIWQCVYKGNCSECGAIYGASERIRDSEGNIIDLPTAQLPIGAYTKEGEYIRDRKDKYIYFDNYCIALSGANYKLINGNSQLKVSVEFTVPEGASGEDIYAASNGKIFNVTTKYLDSARSANKNYAMTIDEYNADTKLLKLSSTFDVMDFTENSNVVGSFNLDLHFQKWNGERTACETYRFASPEVKVTNKILVGPPTANVSVE